MRAARQGGQRAGGGRDGRAGRGAGKGNGVARVTCAVGLGGGHH